jgi:cytochrome b subunit of formate dehydrogenase
VGSGWQGEKERGLRGLFPWAAAGSFGSGPAQLGWFLFFFVLILFSIFAANCFVLFEKANLFEKIKFKLCQLLNKVLMCLVTQKTLFGKV